MNNELIINLDKIHTTELGVERIKKNLSFDTEDVVKWCKEKTKNADIRRYYGYEKTLKFMLIVFVYSMLFMTANAVMPFSQAFKDASVNADPLSAIFLLISSVFNCLVICFIAANSNWQGAKHTIGIIFVVFMIAAFMTQIETLFFGEAFPILTKVDVILIMLECSHLLLLRRC